MKIKTLLITAAVLTLFKTAYAENTVNVLPVDLMTDTLTIEGKLDSRASEDIMIIVTKPGVKMDSITSAEDCFVQQLEKASDENGSYSFSFKITSDEIGDYGIYVKFKGEAPICKSFYFAPAEERQKCIDKITSGEDIEISDFIKKFGLNEFDAIGGASASDMEDALENYGKIADGDFKTVQTILKESAVLSCIKNENTSYIFSEDGAFISDSSVGFSNFDKETGTTLYNVFNNILNTKGRKNVISVLSGTGYSDYNELKKAFAKAVMLYSITETDILGTDYLSDILTSENAAYTGIDIGTYLSCGKKTKVHTELLKNSSYASLDDLESTIKKIVSELAKDSSGGSSSSSSSGNSGSSGLLGPNASGVTNADNSTQTNGFSDISDSHWAKTAIGVLVDRNIISGYPDNTFKPDGKLTREQAVKLICEAFDIESGSAEVEFTDVVSGAWYEEYVRTGVSAGIVNGIGGEYFGVGLKITREDFAVMIYRALKCTTAYGETEFADNDEISDYARRAVSYFKEKGIINGYEDLTFRPKNQITRAEAAMIIYNCTMNR